MCKADRDRIEKRWTYGLLLVWLAYSTAAFAGRSTEFAHEVVTNPDIQLMPAIFVSPSQ